MNNNQARESISCLITVGKQQGDLLKNRISLFESEQE